MSVTSYATLKTAISDFMSWEDTDARIATFIQLTEQRMNREIRHWRMEKRATASVTSRYSALPLDFLEPIRMEIEGVYRPLRLQSVHVLQQERNRVQDASGIPQLYALTGGEIELFPTPSEAQSLEMVYFAPITALSDAAPTNWVLDNHVDAYLYGALMHSAPYLGEDARLTTWATLYANAVMAINDNSNDGKFGGAKRKRLRTA